MRLITKKNLLVVSILLSLLVLVTMEELGFCSYVTGSPSCPIPATDLYESVLLLLALTTLPFSLLTWPLQTAVFESWKRFSVWAVPILIILSYLIIKREESTGSGFFNYEIGPILIGLLYFIYVAISLLIIAITWYKNRN